MKLDMQEIKSLPLVTNRIKLSVDKKEFFTKYAIISYYSLDKEYKNLAYEQLADTPCLSVTGIRARWSEMQYPGVKFFVLTEKKRDSDVLKSLRDYDKIRSMIDTLEDYPEKLQARIIASLAINSLGKSRPGKMMYNDGCLLLCDDRNFLACESTTELVCLKIEVNEYMNLTAKTASFAHPISLNGLRKWGNRVFQAGRDVNGQWWPGLSVKPVVLKKLNPKDIKLDDLYIQKKINPDNHNIVPYWPYNPEDYIHGRLFAISQVVDSVKEAFNPMIDIDFEESDIFYYDEYKSNKDTMALLKTYFAGKSIFIEDPFKNAASEDLVARMKNTFQDVMEGSLLFPSRQHEDSMLIRLCEPKKEKLPGIHYTKSLSRLADSCIATQHKVFSGVNGKDTFVKAEARRILLELLVKDSLVKRRMPEQMGKMLTDWEFMRYKLNNNNIIGASLKLDGDAGIDIRDVGFQKGEMPVDIETFAHDHLGFDDSMKICGARDYMALKKNGNVYLIIDTDEIPILDVALLDDGYDHIVNGKEPLSLFKRRNVAHQYLRGYIGFHLWKTEGLDGEAGGSYSYISGINSENMQIKKSTKMDRMPRARRIFILHKDRPEEVESQIMEICGMMRFGFGRWNEIMTYPFPFKFLYEYLDDVSEISYSKHWSEITFKGDL